jgi:hypothetical protein
LLGGGLLSRRLLAAVNPAQHLARQENMHHRSLSITVLQEPSGNFQFHMLPATPDVDCHDQV